jgi:signal transduction histidine kinase
VATLAIWATFMVPALGLVVPIGAAIDRLARGEVLAAAALLLLGLVLGGLLLPVVATPLIALDRWRARLIDPSPLPPSPRPPSDPASWLRDRWLTATRWRETGYLVAALTIDGILLAALSLFGTSAGVLMAAPFLVSRDNPISVGPWQADRPATAVLLAVLGVLVLVVVVYGWTAGACVQVGLLRRTLEAHDTRALAEELTRVDASRTRLLESFDSERRRIERDLHDGAQQRLVTLAMGLGVTRLEAVDALGADHPVAAGVATAHDQAKVLMDELREFVRGIHPKVLTDVGLVAALEELTADLPLPVTVTSSLDRRPPRPVENAAYFAASEALTNVVRHSDATQASVRLARDDTGLVVEVTDDGRGGALPRPDSGLTWMADRLAAVDGTLDVSSPVGGPTVVRMRIAEPR